MPTDPQPATESAIPGDDWDDLAHWWIDAVRDDPMQSTDMLDVLDELVDGTGGPTIDLGCGEGQVMRRLGGRIIGTDLSAELLAHSAMAGPVVRAQLPGLSWARPGSFERAVACGVIDLLEDHVAFFANTASVVRPGGHLLVVMNHPVVTAPHSEPLVDALGEILWKWGAYFTTGSWMEWAGPRDVRLFHRPLSTLLSDAALHGWQLERMAERGPSDETIARYPEFDGQQHIPTVLGLRWSRSA